MVQWSLLVAAAVGFFLLARNWSFNGLGMAELCLLPGLAFLCIWPGFQWYQRGMNWLPLGESFAALHLFYYVLPCLNGREDWLAVSQPQRWLTLSAVGVFLGSFLIVYETILKSRKPSTGTLVLLEREMNPGIMWVLLGIWLAWSLLLQSRLLPDVGNALNVFRSVATGLGSLSVIYLFFQVGRRRLLLTQRWLVIGGLGLGLIVNFASGFLNGTVQWLGAAMLAFTMGRKQVPVVTLGMCMAVLVLLQLGKADYRQTYWGENMNYSNQKVGLVEGYTTWLSAGWRNLWRNHSIGEGGKQGLTERASLVQVLARAMDVTPAQQPFLKGDTYWMLPELMVPRVFWPAKPRGTLPSETLGIRIGIQTEPGADITGVAVGQIAEAWINFGWLGLVGAGVFFGLLFGFPVQASKSLMPDQMGWLLAAIFLIYCTNLENTVVEILCLLSTALLMGIVTLLSVSHRKVINHGSRRRKRLGVAFGFDGASPKPDADQVVRGPE